LWRVIAIAAGDVMTCSDASDNAYENEPPARLLPRCDSSWTCPPAKPPRDGSKLLVVTCVTRTPSPGALKPPVSGPMTEPSSRSWFSSGLMPPTEKRARPLTACRTPSVSTPAASCASVSGSRSGSAQPRQVVQRRGDALLARYASRPGGGSRARTDGIQRNRLQRQLEVRDEQVLGALALHRVQHVAMPR
jgi:hypothetical protein